MLFVSSGMVFKFKRQNNKEGHKVDTRLHVFKQGDVKEGVPSNPKIADVVARLHPNDRGVFNKQEGREQAMKKALVAIVEAGYTLTKEEEIQIWLTFDMVNYELKNRNKRN